MALGNYTSAAFTTASGVAVAANADVEVRRESDNGLASIFSDRAGSSPIMQPGFQADASGRFEFYAAGIDGGYKITVTKGAESYTVRYQGSGLARERDASNFGASIMGATDAAAVLALLAAYSSAQVDALLGSAATGLRAFISGLTYGNNAGDATNDIDIAAGVCRDSSNAANLTLASTLTKQLDAAWAVGTNAGGLDTGAIGNNDYYIHLIRRPDTGVVDALFSLSSTAPTMPVNYTQRRLIGWFKRVGATIVAFHTYETTGGGIELNWDAPTLDVNLASTLTTARRTDAVKVPLNFSVKALLNVVAVDATNSFHLWVCCPDQTDAAPSGTVTPLANMALSAANQNLAAGLAVRTSSTGTIAARANLATVDLYAVSTMGFEWGRRNVL